MWNWIRIVYIHVKRVIFNNLAIIFAPTTLQMSALSLFLSLLPWSNATWIMHEVILNGFGFKFKNIVHIRWLCNMTHYFHAIWMDLNSLWNILRFFVVVENKQIIDSIQSMSLALPKTVTIDVYRFTAIFYGWYKIWHRQRQINPNFSVLNSPFWMQSTHR